VKGKQ